MKALFLCLIALASSVSFASTSQDNCFSADSAEFDTICVHGDSNRVTLEKDGVEVQAFNSESDCPKAVRKNCVLHAIDAKHARACLKRNHCGLPQEDR